MSLIDLVAKTATREELIQLLREHDKQLVALRTKADPEAIILACVPGGWDCDPQAIADAIREYFKKP